MKYMVSACLAGRSCRYNGKPFAFPLFREMVERGEAEPFCPELLGGLPTPRDCAEIQIINNEKRVLTDKGEDVSVFYRRGADMSARLALREKAECIILKNGSPSCGFGKIYDGSFSGNMIAGQGITADSLREKGLFLFNHESFLQSEAVTLKKIREEDYKEFVQISTEAFQADSKAFSPYGIGGPEGYDSIPWYQEASERGKMFTIRRNAVLVGGLFYTLKSDHRGWINRIFIKPSLQGQGIGRRVFFKLEQKYSSIREWGLDTPHWAEHNQNFYRSMGYRIHREIFSREVGYKLVVLKKKKNQ
ncbi:MAG: hypothetical protein B6241_14975 [Spirochaetaceae bacterium 4572_59]|nr:MAG: hypothetical protein B6241_14975 [Spirochaetaceae bacterium 4572_59]